MSKKSDALEDAITEVAQCGQLPNKLPDWLIRLGVRPGARIISSERIGMDKNNKTDVLIRLENSEPIKISAKLSNADYFGNWYGHIRFIDEFGEKVFYRLTKDATVWANDWIHKTNAPFVGVSICFGRRTGNTAKEFLDIFNYDDVIKVVAGFGEGNHIANALYVTSHNPCNINDVIQNLKPIDKSTIESLLVNFKIAYRPINPMTEGSNRGKNIYTMFKPYNKLSQLETVTSINRLAELGEFVEVIPNCLNHNHVLNCLEKNYNIYIPRKK